MLLNPLQLFMGLGVHETLIERALIRTFNRPSLRSLLVRTQMVAGSESDIEGGIELSECDVH